MSPSLRGTDRSTLLSPYWFDVIRSNLCRVMPEPTDAIPLNLVYVCENIEASSEPADGMVVFEPHSHPAVDQHTPSRVYEVRAVGSVGIGIV